ncbi:hypothetical protein GJ496_011801 [Pomphorhynchus laevis]|nr:hypothetical protein GJ496_011801 [Pomphorhynchus laevis]
MKRVKRRNFEEFVLNQCNHNLKVFFSYVCKMTKGDHTLSVLIDNSNNVVSDDLSKAEFCNSNVYDVLTNEVPSLFTFNDVYNSLKRLKSSIAAGPD